MKALRVKAWDAHFETAESRRIGRLAWVATPNSHDSIAYCELMAHPNGVAHYGAWNLILQIASRCTTRGLLVSGRNVPHTARSLALVSRCPEAIMAEAIPRLLDIGWLEEVDPDAAQPVAGRAQPSAGRPTTTGQDSTGQDTTGRGGQPPPLPPGILEALRAAKADDTPDALDEWAVLVAGLRCRTDVEAEQAVCWLINKANAAGEAVRYARHVKAFLAAWKAAREAKRFRPTGKMLGDR